MGGGESHIMLWWEWWPQQTMTEVERIAYFRRWPPPHCWLPFLIEALWGVDVFEYEGDISYFEKTDALGFGSEQDFDRDNDDPKWLG